MKKPNFFCGIPQLWPFLCVDKRRLVKCQKKPKKYQRSRLNIPGRGTDPSHLASIVRIRFGLVLKVEFATDFALVGAWHGVEEGGGRGRKRMRRRRMIGS